MKNIYSMLLLGGLLLTSCNDYLNVSPKTQIELETFFEDEEGFKDALTGVYVQMKEETVYGGRLTQTTIEHLVSSWDAASLSAEGRLGYFDYKNEQVATMLDEIFLKQYAMIASVNAMLGQIDSRKNVFKTAGLYELVKGEALALRAYLHFDLMRLFGPAPHNPAEGSQLAYVTKFTTMLHEKMSYEQCKSLLISDIDEAATLLGRVDPIQELSIEDMRLGTAPVKDSYFAHRYLRMNYYAAKGLKARIHLWYGDKEKAYIAAKEVLESKNKDGSVKFKLGVAADFAKENFTLVGEHLFGLYDHDLEKRYDANYASLVLKKEEEWNKLKEVLYGNTGKDIRETSLWQNVVLADGKKGNIIKKYSAKPNSQTSGGRDYKQIPMIRISELYLIAAEAAPFGEGLEYFASFRKARNLDLSAPINPEALDVEIVKEYRKEFYAEGQTFYTYKRKNVQRSSFLFLPATATINYVLPLPKIETIN
ncbi:RagB/SusD family nutrient uptake outer membrane protein [Sphingobacterium tabacisoli]|uniref:RagB/SusD family nutrient uptake outer membrane protein n=1 Tax=Sphingobacterium tabacisoli TaxID=2044855 RepID=A0ABW5KW74_9SPHI|nr:RagB/SusD family nutrient uptake outer membrane protein [Sphingobacterium tabacisoli]